MREEGSSRKDILRIAVGMLIGDVLMCIVFICLKRFSLSVVLGAVLGTVFALANLFYLDYSIGQALKKGDSMQSYFRRSYLVRMLIHAACIAIAALAPFINTVAGIVPLFFPKLVIYAMQLLGLYKPDEIKTPAETEAKDER